MPYARREAGVIVGLAANPSSTYPEQVADNDPEVISFLNPPKKTIEETALLGEDIERILVNHLGITTGQINQAKRDRGKPLP